MSNTFNRSGFEESILYSDEDYEPYGFVSPQAVQGRDKSAHSSSRPYEREIEAAVLRRLGSYPIR